MGTMFLVLALLGCGGPLHSKSGTTTTVILIRHAEKTEYGTLSPQGHARAKALVDVVGEMGVEAIYSPNLRRNLDTVKPLADHLGIEITLTPKVSLPMVGKICNEILNTHAGKVVLWVGNISGNLQGIYARLGGEDKGPLRYGQLFILSVPDEGPVRVKKTTFGE